MKYVMTAVGLVLTYYRENNDYKITQIKTNRLIVIRKQNDRPTIY